MQLRILANVWLDCWTCNERAGPLVASSVKATTTTRHHFARWRTLIYHTFIELGIGKKWAPFIFIFEFVSKTSVFEYVHNLRHQVPTFTPFSSSFMTVCAPCSMALVFHLAMGSPEKLIRAISHCHIFFPWSGREAQVVLGLIGEHEKLEMNILGSWFFGRLFGLQCNIWEEMGTIVGNIRNDLNMSTYAGTGIMGSDGNYGM